MPRINFLFVLIIGLTACSPNTAPTPSPVVTSSPTASIPPTSTATEIPSIPNPIDPENMNVLTRAGYLWDEQAGSLKNKDGNTILSFEDGKWVDERGVESSLESLKINLTDGVYFDGEPIVAMLTRTVEINGEMETQVYGPLTEEWFMPSLGVATSQELIDKNGKNDPTPEKWGTVEDITFDAIPIISKEDIITGRLHEERQLHLRDWPENVRIPVLKYIKYNQGDNWFITQFDSVASELGHYYGDEPIPGGRPILWKNDGILNLDVYKYFDANTNEWVIIGGTQYYYEGNTVVLNYEFIGEYADPTQAEFSSTQRAVANPSWAIAYPLVNNSPVSHLLPLELRNRMAELSDKPDTRSSEAGIFLVGDEIFGFQQYALTPARLVKRSLHWYLESENSPLFDEKYPHPIVPNNTP